MNHLINFFYSSWGKIITVLAEQTGTAGGNNAANSVIELPNPLRISRIDDIVGLIINGLIFVAIPVVTLMVLIGAFQMLFSGGDPAKFENGKKTILYAVIGLVVIIVSRGVADIVVSIFR